MERITTRDTKSRVRMHQHHIDGRGLWTGHASSVDRTTGSNPGVFELGAHLAAAPAASIVGVMGGVRGLLVPLELPTQELRRLLMAGAGWRGRGGPRARAHLRWRLGQLPGGGPDSGGVLGPGAESQAPQRAFVQLHLAAGRVCRCVCLTGHFLRKQRSPWATLGGWLWVPFAPIGAGTPRKMGGNGA